jgi:RNA polymerase sigma-70 factor (ECF subfamily)
MEGVSHPGGLEAVIAANETPLLRYAARLLNNSAAAQDVVQTAFIRLADRWPDTSRWNADHVRHWLYRTTHNAALDFIRAEERRRKLHEAHAQEAAVDDPPRQDEALEHADRKRLALDALQQLPEAERQVMILRLQNGLSYQEIARVTGRTEGNVGCLLSTAAKELARLMRKSGAAAP